MALTKFQIKVYAELGTKQKINFVTTRKTRQFNLAGAILAERFVNNAGVTSNTRITIKRTDQFNKDGTNRLVYRRVGFTRFVNMDEDRLAGDLGYDIDQVIDYINGEANKVEDGFRFLSDGAHVGYAETANFTNGIGVTVQNGIATITPRQIGIATAGGTVGSGISLFDFRGAGVSTVTVNTASGIGTINITGGGGGIGTQFADEQKLSFGTDPTSPGNTNHQLQIWSSIYTNGGSGNTALGANIIKSASTARNLRVQTNASFVVEDTAGQNFIRASHPDWINVVTPDQIPGGKGSVELYYLNEGGDFQNLDGLRLYTTGVGVSIVGVATASGGFIGTIRSSDVVGLVTAGQIQSIAGSQITGTIDSTQLSPHITGLGGVNFTLGDSDATPAFNLVDATGYLYSNLVGVPSTHQTTINEFQWYQQYANPGGGSATAGPGITTVNPGISSNPYYYGTQLKPYQEMTWTHSLSDVGAYFIGVWGGSTSFTPANAGDVALWEKSLVFRNSVSDGHHIDYSGTTFDSTGFGFAGGGTGIYTSISNNTSLMRLRYNGDTNKLEILKGTTPVGIATANVAEDGNPITISLALSTNAHLPGITTVQYYVDQTNFKYHNSNRPLENNTHDSTQGVAFYDRKLQRGEELVFTQPGNSAHIGIWNAGVGIAGTYGAVTTKGNWQIKWQYNQGANDWEASNTFNGPTGVEFNRDIVANNGTYAIRLDHTTQKLQLWQISSSYDWLLSNSASGIGTTESYIYFAAGDPTYGSQLPSVSEVRSQDFTVKSYNDSARPGVSYYDGTRVDDVWKSNRSLRPGLKVKFTVPTSAANQYWATAFEGTEDLGSGQTNAYSSGEMTWRLTNQEKFVAHTDCTLNTNYTAVDSGNNTTLSLPGRNMSWRYNSDNTWDLFDEDTDEVVISGDDSLGGSDMYPHLLSVNNSTEPLQDYVQYEWDWNQNAWFIEHRDWSSGHNGNTALTLRNNAMPMKTGANSLEQSDGYFTITNANVNVTWGEKMRPGQELKFTMLSQTSANAARNNMIIGVLDSTYSSYDHGFRFHSNGALKVQSDQDAGVTVQAGITTTCAGASMRLKYENGTNKLKLDRVVSGVRTTLAVSDAALDGNPIHISLGGNSTRLPTTTGVEYYGWEVAHEPPGYYNPWGNWRIGGFPENQTHITVGVHTGTSTTVLDWATDQVWRHKDGLAPGYKMHWISPVSQTNSQIGVFSSNNPTSSLTNLENDSDYWDWSWQTNTSEQIDELKGWTFNTSNSNYSGVSTSWTDPNPGATRFSLRYHANNTMDLYDETNDEVIINKTVANDGNPVYISWVAGGNTVSYDMMNDDFFGGGDVGIALTTTAV